MFFRCIVLELVSRCQHMTKIRTCLEKVNLNYYCVWMVNLVLQKIQILRSSSNYCTSSEIWEKCTPFLIQTNVIVPMNSFHESIPSPRITQGSTRSIIRSDVGTAAVNPKGRAATPGTLLQGVSLVET